MEPDVAQLHQLPLLYEKHLPHSVELLAYSDRHDLIATTDAQEVVVYRINGQVAFSIKAILDTKVSALSWKPDGSRLAIGRSDGTCYVHSGEDGRLLSRISTRTRIARDDWKLDLSSHAEERRSAETPHTPLRIRWTSYNVSGSSTESQSLALESENSQETVEAVGNLRQLASSIATLDCTKVLPRLNALPAHGVRAGPEGSQFSSQANTDSLFEAGKAHSESIDTLLIPSSSGHIRVLLEDSLEIGTSDPPSHDSLPLLDASGSQSESQAVLYSLDSGTHKSYGLSLIGLPLSTLASPLLHIIATNTRRIQNLISYITQTARCMQHDFTTGQQFPQRWINILADDLSAKQEGDVSSSLYQLAMTGHFTATVLEWLTDIVKEQNHKRWDQAVNAMYTHIQDHIFSNLLPALDRLHIAASTLRGQASFHEGSSKFPVSLDAITNLTDCADSVRLVAQKLQLLVITEHRQFRAFSKWIRLMIDVGAAGPGSKGGIETEEREVPNLDYNLLLAYIKDTLGQSKLAVHINQLPELEGSCSRKEFFEHPIVTQLTHVNVVKAITDTAALSQTNENVCLNLPALAMCLAARVREVLEVINNWQSKMLPKPQVEPIHFGADIDVSPLDMEIWRQGGDSVNVLFKTPDALKKLSHRMDRRGHKDSGKSAFEVVDVVSGDVLDGKLTEDHGTVVLSRDGLSTSCFLSYDQKAERRVLHAFADDFQASQIFVGGRKGKKVAVALSADRRQWQVLDLDAAQTSE